MESVSLLDIHEFDSVKTCLTDFFRLRGAIEAPVYRPDLLAACEDPKNIATFYYEGGIWPHSQTGQMHLEQYLLRYSPESIPGGVYCNTISWREEPKETRINGRHEVIFPLFEYETYGNFDDLKETLTELLVHLGYGNAPFPEATYQEICESYKTKGIGHAEEQQICRDFGNAFLLTDFPESSDPFWNMRRDPAQGVAKKIDVILDGMETIGCGERSCDPIEMINLFHSIGNGEYAQKLFREFGKERMLKSLNQYLSLPFKPRYGFGIGLTRLMNSLQKQIFFSKDE